MHTSVYHCSFALLDVYTHTDSKYMFTGTEHFLVARMSPLKVELFIYVWRPWRLKIIQCYSSFPYALHVLVCFGACFNSIMIEIYWLRAFVSPCVLLCICTYIYNIQIDVQACSVSHPTWLIYIIRSYIAWKTYVDIFCLQAYKCVHVYLKVFFDGHTYTYLCVCAGTYKYMYMSIFAFSTCTCVSIDMFIYTDKGSVNWPIYDPRKTWRW